MNENPTVHPHSRHLLRLMIVAAVLLIAVLVSIAGYLEQWLWMQQLDYTGILLDASVSSVRDVLLGFCRCFSVPVDQSPPRCQK